MAIRERADMSTNLKGGRRGDAIRTRWSIRIAAFVVLGLMTAFVSEIICRAYWHLVKQVPFFGTENLWIAFYPEVVKSGVLTADFSRPESTFDVLLLGGSVLSEDFGPIAEELESQFKSALSTNVRVFNLAAAAKTSKDSLIKYQMVFDKPFDLVVIYDSINDVRMNNCRADAFRNDYSHCAWYRQFELTTRHPESRWLVLPYTLHYLWLESLERMGWFIPRHRPDDRYLSEGVGTATAGCLRQNLEELLRLARRQNHAVVLSTFAIHIPVDYSITRFQAKTLDYREHISPVEIWGTPVRVAQCMAAHDHEIRNLAAIFNHVVFVDQATLMPRGKRYFNDICHLTNEGCERFARHIVEALASRGESVEMSRSSRTHSSTPQSN